MASPITIIKNHKVLYDAMQINQVTEQEMEFYIGTIHSVKGDTSLNFTCSGYSI
jgi:hypothetical protein